MPARGQYDPQSLPSRIRDWFAEHPGLHRCQDVARDLGYTRTWAVANEMGRLYRDGLLVRTRVPVEGRSKPITYYADADEARRRPELRGAPDDGEPTRQDADEEASSLGHGATG